MFERFPRLKFVMTEMGAAWIPPLLKQLDAIIANVRKGEIGELKYTEENALARSATEYFHQNCWVAASQPGPADAAARTMMGADRFMWGSDYPHDEGTGPFTTEHLRQVFHDADPAELKRILAENAAKLYDFDLNALAPRGRSSTGRPWPRSRSRSRSCRRTRTARCSRVRVSSSPDALAVPAREHLERGVPTANLPDGHREPQA